MRKQHNIVGQHVVEMRKQHNIVGQHVVEMRKLHATCCRDAS